MLPNSFLDWWFAPWEHNPAAAPQPWMTDRLAQRDGYRLYCAQGALAPDLPPQCDPAWHVVAGSDGPQLRAAARLFAGLIAARENNAAALAALTPGERSWCLRVAATQPLAGAGPLGYAHDEPMDVRGLAELACHLERGFPGLWPRVRLALPAALAQRVAQLAAAAPAASASASHRRLQRCWQMCRQRGGDAP